jgi:hypothetical protein
MTAQQQLAELNEMTALLKSTPHTPHDAGEWARDAVYFIRDHGPAIAELIEAADGINERGISGDWKRLGASIRKLTQEA